MDDATAFELFDTNIGPEGRAEISKSALEVMARTWEGKTHINNSFLAGKPLIDEIVHAVLPKLHPQASIEISNFAFVTNALMGVKGIDDLSEPSNLFQAAFREWLESVKEMSKPSQ